MHTYLLNDQIGSIEVMIELLALTLSLVGIARQPHHVTDIKLTELLKPIRKLMLTHVKLFLVQLNSSTELYQLLWPCLSIEYIPDRSVSQHGLDGGLDARVIISSANNSVALIEV
jgi:hypothetical protein